MTESSSNDLLLSSLSNYYSKTDRIKILQDIIENQSSRISLRLIDWYVTNYCKHNNVVYILKKRNQEEYFNVYMNYRSQLKAFKKVLFDPFRRRDRINFQYDKNKVINTTIGQLNFFRWAIENDVIKQLNNNIDEVEKNMISLQKNFYITPVQKSKNTKTSRSSKNSIKNMTTFTGNTLISFK